MITIHWKALLAAFFLFAAGVAVGVLGALGYGLRHTRALLREAGPAPTRFERAAGRLEKRLVADLALDETQAAMVRREFARATEEMRTLRQETVQRTRRTVGAALLRIGAELPPDKRDELRRLATRRLERLGLEPSAAAEPEPPPPPAGR